MYSIKHLLDENEKITKCKTEIEFIFFTFIILKENDDINTFTFRNTQDCIDYINEYCDNLELL